MTNLSIRDNGVVLFGLLCSLVPSKLHNSAISYMLMQCVYACRLSSNNNLSNSTGTKCKHLEAGLHDPEPLPNFTSKYRVLSSGSKLTPRKIRLYLCSRRRSLTSGQTLPRITLSFAASNFIEICPPSANCCNSLEGLSEANHFIRMVHPVRQTKLTEILLFLARSSFSQTIYGL